MSESMDKSKSPAATSDSGEMEGDAGNITFPTLQAQTPAPLEDDGNSSLPTLMTTKGAAGLVGRGQRGGGDDADDMPTSDMVSDGNLNSAGALVSGPASSGPAEPDDGVPRTVVAVPASESPAQPAAAALDPVTAVISQLVAAGVLDPKAPDRVHRDSLALLDDRYELISKLGIGGMGAVFLAYDRVGECNVAVKVLLPRFLADAGARQRFIEEAKQMNRIPAHAHVLVVKGFGSPAKPYYVMEYMAGGSLTQLIRRVGALPRGQALRLAADIVKAVCYLHESAGLIHRDIKPDNVMLSDDHTARLCDFGLIRAPGIGHEGLRAGTLAYMPPEVVTDARKNVAFEWDIYSVGAVLYEMLAGRRPYDEVFKASPSLHEQIRLLKTEALKRGPKPIEELNRAADPSLVRIAQWCMAREAKDRYYRMTDVLADLQRVELKQSPRGPRTHGADKGGSWRKWAAAAMVLVALVAGGWWGYGIINGNGRTPPLVSGDDGQEPPPVPPGTGTSPQPTHLLDEKNAGSTIELEIMPAVGKTTFSDGEFFDFRVRSEKHDGYLTVLAISQDSTNLNSSARPIHAIVLYPCTPELASERILAGVPQKVPHWHHQKQIRVPPGPVLIKVWWTTKPVWLSDKSQGPRYDDKIYKLVYADTWVSSIDGLSLKPKFGDMFKPDEWGTATLTIEAAAKAGAAPRGE